MAVGHIPFDRSTPVGGMIAQGFSFVEQGLLLLNNAYRAQEQMRNVHEPPDPPTYEYVATEVGYEAVNGITAIENAQNGYEELEAFLQKLTTDAPVENVATAIRQALAKFRN